MESKKYKNNLSLVKISFSFWFLVLLNLVAPIINTLVVSIVPNQGIIFAESVGVSTQILNIFVTVISFATGGIGVILGQQIGRKDSFNDLYKTIFTIIVTSVGFSIIIFVLSISLSPAILLAFLKNGSQQYNDAIIYIEVMSVNILIFGLLSSFNNTVNSYGFSNHSILFSCIGIVLDLSMTLLFVLVFNIGILGSALGTLVANIVVVICMLFVFLKKITKIKFNFIYFQKSIFKKLVSVSLPISFEKISYTFSLLVLGIITAQIGLKFPNTFIVENNTNLLNLSRTMILTFTGLITITSIAFGNGVEIIVSRHIGNKNYDDAKKIVNKALLISLVADLILSFILFFMQKQIISFFALQNNIVYIYSNKIQEIFFIPMILMFFLQIGRTFNIIFIASARSSGNITFNSIWSIIITWTMTLIAFVIGFVFGSDNNKNFLYALNGVFLISALDEIFRGAINFGRWKTNKWMRFDLFKK